MKITSTYQMRINGNCTIPINGPLKQSASQKLTVFEIAKILEYMPLVLVSPLKGFNMHHERCEKDKFFAKLVGRRKFRAPATADMDSLTIDLWSSSGTSYEIKHLIAHELGHIYDGSFRLKNGNYFSHSSGWLATMDLDFGSSHGRATKFVSQYAQSFEKSSYGNALIEDFAESVMFYVVGNELFRQWYHARYAVLQELLS